MQDQQGVWDLEYGKRGTSWGKKTLNLPDVFSGKSVLEVGSGNGKTLSSILSQQPSYLLGVDFSKNALRLAKNQETLSNVPLLLSDCLRFPIKSESFDVLALYYVLDNMLAAERAAALSEAKRVLKNGGQVVFEDFAVGDFRQKTAKSQGSPEENTILKKKGLLCHYFTASELQALFIDFKDVMISFGEHSPIKGRPELKRKVLRLSARK